MVVLRSGHKKSGCEKLVMKSWLQMDVVMKNVGHKYIPDEYSWGIPGYTKWMEEIY